MVETFYAVGCPVKIALVTDMHDRPCKGLLPSLKRQRPDIICIGGDFVVGFHPDKSRAIKRLKKLHIARTRRHMYAVQQTRFALPILAACARLAPTYVSLGNHDWMFTPAELRFIEKTGVTILDNAWVKRGDLVIGGLTSATVTEYRDYRSHFPEDPSGKIYPERWFRPLEMRPDPDTAWLKGFAAQPGYKILLCHHPEYRTRYLAGLPIDLILCGHAHGGQIRIGDQGLFAPGQGFLPKYTSGVHGNMVISRGLANTASFIPRLGNPAEVVYLEG